jgi:exopolyphosphatase/guanosine-5'-triphosphate,3'-diphosphate pyrophosphatase
VLDVGSNTVHLLIVDADSAGARPTPAYEHRSDLRLAELLDTSGRVTRAGADQLVQCCAGAVGIAEDKGASAMLAFATSALREAPNVERVLARVGDEAGVRLAVLSGEDEARVTFLAVRRWYGWSSGRLLAVDIGGGSLEIASGLDEDPDVAVSLPLGAGRLTREQLGSGSPKPKQLRRLRTHVRAEIAQVVGRIARLGPPDHPVATSKTFRSLARLAGAAPAADGPYTRRTLSHADLVAWLPRLADLSPEERARLPGVSSGRSAQLLAGAIVADATMDLLGIDELDICPWALREGLILRYLDRLDDALGWRSGEGP